MAYKVLDGLASSQTLSLLSRNAPGTLVIFHFLGHVGVFPGSGPLHVLFPLIGSFLHVSPGQFLQVSAQNVPSRGDCPLLVYLKEDSVIVLTPNILFFAVRDLVKVLFTGRFIPDLCRGRVTLGP